MERLLGHMRLGLSEMFDGGWMVLVEEDEKSRNVFGFREASRPKFVGWDGI